jgi:hypothetical protein
MARRKQGPKDLTGIRQRGGTYQVWLFGGLDPVTGKQLMRGRQISPAHDRTLLGEDRLSTSK